MEGPAELMQHDVVVPPAEVLEVREAGAATVDEVLDVVRLAADGGLVTAAGILAGLVPQGDQAAEVDRDVIGPPDVQGEGRPVQALTQKIAA